MEENKVLQFLQKHWAKLCLALVMLLAAGFWLENTFSSRHSNSKQDFLVINQIMERFKKGEPLAIQSIECAENILKRHPELHPKIDGILATSFLLQQNASKSLVYAKSRLDHVKDDLDPLYLSYGSTSFLIAEQKYEEALVKSSELQKELVSVKGYETLAGLNLLRLIFLADVLGKADIKYQRWTELKAHPSYETISTLFHEGQLSLQDYFPCF